jgi:sugar phosphate isomerase/epimerase
MTFYVSTACLPGTDGLKDRLAALRQAGLNSVELGAGVHVSPADWSEWEPPPGMQVVLHNYFPPPPEPFVLNLASANPEIRRRSMELACAALEASARLGAAFYSVHGGFITDAVGFDAGSFVFPSPVSPQDRQSAMDRFVDSVVRLAEHAATCEAQLLVENNVCEPKHRGKLLFTSAGDFEELFARCPTPYVGMLLDTGHLNVSAETLGFDRFAFVEAVAPFVRAFHLHDNDGRTDQHQPLREGSWVLDVLQNPGLSGCAAIIESKFSDLDQLRRNVEWLAGRSEAARHPAGVHSETEAELR